MRKTAALRGTPGLHIACHAAMLLINKAHLLQGRAIAIVICKEQKKSKGMHLERLSEQKVSSTAASIRQAVRSSSTAIHQTVCSSSKAIHQTVCSYMKTLRSCMARYSPQCTPATVRLPPTVLATNCMREAVARG